MGRNEKRFGKEGLGKKGEKWGFSVNCAVVLYDMV